MHIHIRTEELLVKLRIIRFPAALAAFAVVLTGVTVQAANPASAAQQTTTSVVATPASSMQVAAKRPCSKYLAAPIRPNGAFMQHCRGYSTPNDIGAFYKTTPTIRATARGYERIWDVLRSRIGTEFYAVGVYGVKANGVMVTIRKPVSEIPNKAFWRVTATTPHNGFYRAAEISKLVIKPNGDFYKAWEQGARMKSLMSATVPQTVVERWRLKNSAAVKITNNATGGSRQILTFPKMSKGSRASIVWKDSKGKRHALNNILPNYYYGDWKKGNIIIARAVMHK
jgi:hypothetical protein